MGVNGRDLSFQFYLLPSAFAPALATFVVRAWITKEGFADAGLELNLHKWRYYLVGWLLPMPGVGVIILLAVATGLGEPDGSLDRALGIPAPDVKAPIPDNVWLHYHVAVS